jgi:hypothetical protein
VSTMIYASTEDEASPHESTIQIQAAIGTENEDYLLDVISLSLNTFVHVSDSQICTNDLNSGLRPFRSGY